jgi:uncharacterized membrane protein YhdT
MEMIAILIMHNLHRHMDEEDFEKYSSGAVPESDVAVYEEHLLACEKCRIKLQETDEYRSAMRIAICELRSEEVAAKQEGGWRLAAGFPVFATLACLILVMIFAVRSNLPRPPFAVALTAMRGNGSALVAPAGRGLSLYPDLTGIGSASFYRLEIVDQTGQPVWQGSFSRSQNGVSVPGQSAGLYFVRVYRTEGELLREFALEIK